MNSAGFLLCLCGFVATVTAQINYRGLNTYTGSEYNRPRDKVIVYQEGFKGGRYYYGGHYKGKCYQDGLYFYDDRRFVYCSNGNPYVQPCAPGTRNAGDGSYKPGYYYGYSDFCNVNLVDYGYGPDAYQPYGYEDTVAKDPYPPHDAYKVETNPYERNNYPRTAGDLVKSDPYLIPAKDTYTDFGDKSYPRQDHLSKVIKTYEVKENV